MDFRTCQTGDILEFKPARSSIVTKPYLVEVIKASSTSITTNIPHMHSLEIPIDMEYHSNRAKKVGTIQNEKLVERLNDLDNGRK